MITDTYINEGKRQVSCPSKLRGSK